MNARALAIKAGVVLGELLSNRAFGNRPVTLAGYSLGSLVIFEALNTLSDAQTIGKRASDRRCIPFWYTSEGRTDAWTSVRRIVAGRLVNWLTPTMTTC